MNLNPIQYIIIAAISIYLLFGCAEALDIFIAIMSGWTDVVWYKRLMVGVLFSAVFVILWPVKFAFEIYISDANDDKGG